MPERIKTDYHKIESGIWKKYKWGELGTCAGKTANKGNKENLGPNPEPRAENKDFPSRMGYMGMGPLDAQHADFSLIREFPKKK